METLKYNLNTESHGNHWTSNGHFGAPAVAHRGVRERMLETDMAAHLENVANLYDYHTKAGMHATR